MPNTLPAATRNLDQALRDLREHGLCLMPEVLDSDTVARVRAALYRAADDERSGANTTHNTERAAVFPCYTTRTYRTQENWFLALEANVVKNAFDTLLTLLAYKSELFGLVYGRSPR